MIVPEGQNDTMYSCLANAMTTKCSARCSAANSRYEFLTRGRKNMARSTAIVSKPEQKGSKFNFSAEFLTPPTPSISPIPPTNGKQVFEPPSPTPRNRSGLLSTTEFQHPLRARNLVSNTTDLTSATGYVSHYDASAKEITEAGTVSIKPALGNRDPLPLIKLVQRQLFPQEQAGMRKQEYFGGLDAEDSIELPPVTSKVKKIGRSSPQPEEPAGQRHHRAHSKPSKCLQVEGSIDLPSVTSNVKKSGRSSPRPEEPAGKQHHRAHSRPSECLLVEESIDLPSVTSAGGTSWKTTSEGS